MKRALPVVLLTLFACASPPQAPARAPVAPTSMDVLTSSTLRALHEREIWRMDALLACSALSSVSTQDSVCVSQAPPLAIDDAALRALLLDDVRDAHVRHVSSSLARAVIEDALAPGADERSTRRRALTFLDERAVFSLDDLPALLAQAKRLDRRRLLVAARTALAQSSAISAEERTILDAAAAHSGTTRAQLLARRAGIDVLDLRVLIDSILTRTAPLLAGVASDVTLLADVSNAGAAQQQEAVRSAASQARVYGDSLLMEAMARAASAPIGSDAMRDWARSLLVDVRIAALSVAALLDGADENARDRLASRILMDALADEGDLVQGAGALLWMDEGGAAVERLAALLSTPALAQLTSTGARAADLSRAWREAPPLAQQGHPAAFIEALQTLAER